MVTVVSGLRLFVEIWLLFTLTNMIVLKKKFQSKVFFENGMTMRNPKKI